MFNARLAGDHLYGECLFTWLSLVMSLMVFYFVLSFSHEMSWMRSVIESNRFLRIFLPTLVMKRGLDSYNALRHLEIPGVSATPLKHWSKRGPPVGSR